MNNLDTTLDDVRLACSQARCERAIDLLEQAVRLRPSGYQLHYWLGVCHSGGCRQHQYTNPDIAFAYLQHALRLAPPGVRLCRAAILTALGNTWLERRQFTPASATQSAVECHSEAGRIYRAFRQSSHWAREQFNLGNDYCRLSEVTGEDHWQEAVSCYQQALTVRTREANPESYAAVLENLGTAYRHLATREAASNLGASLGCYRRALRIFTKAGHPVRHAALHINLGNVFLSAPARDEETRIKNAVRALRHFAKGLETPIRGQNDRQYAIGENGRAQAYVRLSNLGAAMDCLQKAYCAFMSCGEEEYATKVRSQMKYLHELQTRKYSAASSDDRAAPVVNR